MLNQRVFRIPRVRIPFLPYEALGDVLQLAERVLCKHEVIGSSPIISNRLTSTRHQRVENASFCLVLAKADFVVDRIEILLLKGQYENKAGNYPFLVDICPFPIRAALKNSLFLKPKKFNASPW